MSCLVFSFLLSQICDCTLQCLHTLHEEQEVCHLGINPDGVSFKTMPVKPWDRVALINSGSGAALDSHQADPGCSCFFVMLSSHDTLFAFSGF